MKLHMTRDGYDILPGMTLYACWPMLGGGTYVRRVRVVAIERGVIHEHRADFPEPMGPMNTLDPSACPLYVSARRCWRETKGAAA